MKAFDFYTPNDISYVINKKYEVADCIIINKRREPRYKTVHHYVTIGIGNTWQEELFTDAHIYYDDQVGSDELVNCYIVKKQQGRGIRMI